MHQLLIILFALIALFWLTYGLRAAYGATRLPWLKNYVPSKDADCPTLSIIFAARDEEQKLPEALATLVAIDYPRLEILAVNDRSTDNTGKILDEFAAAYPQLKVVHVRELPDGWLGKPHALQMGYEASTGEWLLFTDADVRFRTDVLRRSVALVREQNWNHLVLFGDVDMSGFWDKVLLTFFGMSFNLATRPHEVSKPNSRAYVGVGAFQLLKRSAYERCGTHRRLAMEVIDDMMLGKLVKAGGFRSGVAIAQDAVRIHWHLGLRNLIRGVEKNFFAGAQYSKAVLLGQVAALLVFNVVPLFGVIFGHGWVRWLAAIGLAVPFFFELGVDVVMHVSPLYAPTFPLGAVVFTYMLLRSAAVTLKQGGIMWRDTFYPLEELRRAGK